MAKLNSKILCFVDETGTAGNADFALGFLWVFARDASKADKVFSDLLPAGFGEFHCHKLDAEFIRAILAGFAASPLAQPCLRFAYKSPISHVGCRQTIYANTLIEGVKTTSKHVRSVLLPRARGLNNVEVIVDANSQNLGKTFDEIVGKASREDGMFKGVKRTIQLDSAASRLLQIADGVAYCRRLVERGDFKAKLLSSEFGIKVI
ncbi:DUF3800 domain-containing protein [Rhodobacter capsulatus]|uniref:DUF3800 domain-containing protein n=1 Tax=Rhodobacter capsulatus TaxID=1061 RepID=UPI004025917E